MGDGGDGDDTGGVCGGCGGVEGKGLSLETSLLWCRAS